MVHRGLGQARITYPRTVQLSPADPMTSASLPSALLRLPGSVSRPVRLGYSLQDAEQHLIALVQAREVNPRDLALRDAEHEALSRYVIAKYGPVTGRMMVASFVPVYSAGKLILKPLGGYKGATPPSFREVAAGLRPLVTLAPTITGYQTVGVWPGAVLATGAQCAAYLATHGGGPGSGCRAVYSNGTLGPLMYAPAPTPTTKMARLRGLGYYPNLGQAVTVGAGPSIPTWVWWVAAGAAALLVGGLFFGGPSPRRQPAVRTVTRTTY